MNILIISQNFFSYAANTTCIKEIVSEIVKRGHSCRIVTRYGVIYDSSKNDEYTPFPSNVNSNSQSFIQTIIKKALTFFTWPLQPFENVSDFYNTVVEEYERDTPDIIFATCFTYSNLIVASRIKKNYGDKVTYVSYFLDAIFCGQIPRMYSESLHDFMALRAEKKVLYNADKIVMMQAAQSKYTKNRGKIPYYANIKFLDIPLYIPEKLKAEVMPISQDSVINFFFAGTMPKNIRDPHYILELFNKLDDHDCYLKLAGRYDYKDVVDYYTTNNDHIIDLGLLSREDVESNMQNCDILVNIGNSVPNMAPSKIFEYMSTGKPLLTTIKVKSDRCRQYYDQYPNCLVLNEYDDVLYNFHKLCAFIMDIRSGKYREPISDNIFNDSKPSTLVDFLEI